MNENHTEPFRENEPLKSQSVEVNAEINRLSDEEGKLEPIPPTRDVRVSSSKSKDGGDKTSNIGSDISASRVQISVNGNTDMANPTRIQGTSDQVQLGNSYPNQSSPGENELTQGNQQLTAEQQNEADHRIAMEPAGENLDAQAPLAEQNGIIHMDQPNQAPQPQTVFEKFLVESFKENITFNKPIITGIGFTLSLIVFALLFGIGLNNEVADLSIVIYGYWFQLATELIILALYYKASPHLTVKYTHWAILPWLLKALEVALVHIDIESGLSLSLYFSFLIIIHCFFILNTETCYAKVNPLGFCMGLILSIAQLLVVIKLTSSASYTYRPVFMYLFYFFCVVVFFVGILFIASVLLILCWLCGFGREFPIKPRIAQAFCGIDVGLQMTVCNFFAIFAENFELCRKALNNGSLDQAEVYRQEYDSARKVTCVLMFICAAYVAVRFPISLYLTWGIAPPRPPNNAMRRPRRDNQPRVEKPSQADSVLNLFRINTNYFSSKPMTAEEQANQGEANDQSDGLCSLCYAEPSTCIILECKHAGICKTCSIDMMKKSTLCPFCRKDIVKVCVVEKIEETKYKIIEEIKV